jgi:hypothetical protein
MFLTTNPTLCSITTQKAGRPQNRLQVSKLGCGRERGRDTHTEREESKGSTTFSLSWFTGARAACSVPAPRRENGKFWSVTRSQFRPSENCSSRTRKLNFFLSCTVAWTETEGFRPEGSHNQESKKREKSRSSFSDVRRDCSGSATATKRCHTGRRTIYSNRQKKSPPR